MREKTQKLEQRNAEIDNLLLLVSNSNDLIKKDSLGNIIAKVGEVENKLNNYLIKFLDNDVDLFLLQFNNQSDKYSIIDYPIEFFLIAFNITTFANQINDNEFMKMKDSNALFGKNMIDAYLLIDETINLKTKGNLTEEQKKAINQLRSEMTLKQFTKEQLFERLKEIVPEECLYVYKSLIGVGRFVEGWVIKGQIEFFLYGKGFAKRYKGGYGIDD